jgi:hypothetical protein
MRSVAIILLLLTSTAIAEDKEPSLGPISPNGSIIEIQDYRCEVRSPYSIICLNIGRVCRDWREREREHTKKTFGCAIKGEPTYPCPPWKEEQKRIAETSKFSCWPMVIGGF